MTIIRIYSLSK